MDGIETILTRRSIRKYDGQIVDEAVLDEVIACGMASPSGFEGRPWHFVKITDASLMNQLADAMEGCDMMRETSTGILVCGDTSQDKLPGIWIQDCAACTQNMLLAIHAKGLASVWMAMYMVEVRESACRRILGVPENLIPFALLPIGGAAETGSADPRKDKGRVHLNHWDA